MKKQLPPLSPSIRINSAPAQTPMSHVAPGQDMPTTDLHKMALSVAMSNLLKRKKGQKKGT